MLLAPVPYAAEWPALFDQMRQEIELGTGLTSIFHIGSTAVTGLWAKPIIDIQLGVPALDRFDPTCLDRCGFTFAPEITRDDAPDGMPPDPALWRKLYARRHVQGRRVAHLHIRQIDLPNFRLALLVRDFLRHNTLAAGHYAAFKRQAAQLTGPSSDAGGTGPYLDLKDPMVGLLILMSETWAQQVNWVVPDR